MTAPPMAIAACVCRLQQLNIAARAVVDADADGPQAATCGWSWAVQTIVFMRSPAVAQSCFSMQSKEGGVRMAPPPAANAFEVQSMPVKVEVAAGGGPLRDRPRAADGAAVVRAQLALGHAPRLAEGPARRELAGREVVEHALRREQQAVRRVAHQIQRAHHLPPHKARGQTPNASPKV